MTPAPVPLSPALKVTPCISTYNCTATCRLLHLRNEEPTICIVHNGRCTYQIRVDDGGGTGIKLSRRGEQQEVRVKKQFRNSHYVTRRSRCVPYKHTLTRSFFSIGLYFLVFRCKWNNSFLSEEVANKNTTNLRQNPFNPDKANQVRSA